MGPRRHLPALALAVLACTTRVEVRPGGRERPTVFRVPSGAEVVTLSGSMTGWRPRRLELRDGLLELGLDLPPGRYEYRLEVLDAEGSHVIFPEGVERTPDGFGGENAVVRVP